MPSLYRIYFSRDSTVLSLPINPEKLPETKESDNGEYNVLGLGPVMQPRTPKLRKVTISGLFPGRRLPWMSAAVFLPPSVYITFFKSAMDQKRPIVYTPVRYYENGTPFLGGGMGFECLVTSFKTEERGGETGDFYFDLTITEYKDFSPQKAVLQGSSGNFSPAAHYGILCAEHCHAGAFCRCCRNVYCQCCKSDPYSSTQHPKQQTLCGCPA